jgi:arylsulfatase A-like enzyme
VILVVIDTLRADHVHSYGYQRNITPNLDRIASGGLLFERAISTCSWTQPSMASLFTSTYPLVHHVRGAPDGSRIEVSVLPPDLVTMAEFLKGQGLVTRAVSSQPWTNPLAGFGQGFDDFETVSKLLDEREAEKVMDRALHWLSSRSGKERFFLYIHMMGPHYPYIPPPDFQGRFTTGRLRKVQALLEGKEYNDQIKYLIGEGKRAFMSDPGLLSELIGLYDEEVAYSDHQVGRLWSLLDSRDMLDGTMLIVLSDHGEEFLEHNMFVHGHNLFRETVEVPLIVHYPPLGRGIRIAGIVSLMDVFPTIVELFNAEPPYPSQGRSLMDMISGGGDHSPALSENLGHGLVKLTTPSHSIIYQASLAHLPDRTWLFDLNEDPLEKADVSDEYPDITERMLGELLDMEYQNQKIKIKPVSSRSLTREQIEQLKAIGYLH